MHNVYEEVSLSNLFASGTQTSIFFSLALLHFDFKYNRELWVFLPLTWLLCAGVAGMMNWTAAIAPDVLKSRLQTGTTWFLT